MQDTIMKSSCDVAWCSSLALKVPDADLLTELMNAKAGGITAVGLLGSRVYAKSRRISSFGLRGCWQMSHFGSCKILTPLNLD